MHSATSSPSRKQLEESKPVMKLADKGPIRPPPTMPGLLGRVTGVIQTWPGVIAATHWDLYRPTVPDGADFYVGDTEIGHLHLNGEAHVATDSTLFRQFVDGGKAQPFRFRQDPNYRWWTQATMATEQQAQDVLELFRANYGRLCRLAQAAA